MKQIFFKGGRADQHQDPHAYVIEHIQREDEMMQKVHEKKNSINNKYNNPNQKMKKLIWLHQRTRLRR